MTYAELLRITRPDEGLIREDPAPLPLDEIEIQSRWFAGYFPREYFANHGQKITILSPGEWNRGAGPDFIKATIEIDGERHHGPIELDIDSTNWDHHGHSLSEHFDDVILHLVIRDQGPTFFTRTSSHREVPRVQLCENSVAEALGRPRLTQALARPGACLTPLAHMEAPDVHELLQEAAVRRASIKATRFQNHTAWHSHSQALWEALAESLGFSANRLPMRLLAQRLPIDSLKKYPAREIEALLFGSAGFLAPSLHEEAPTDSKEYLESLWQDWWKHRDDFEFSENRKLTWSTRATRPGNHPQRRLGALAAIATKWPLIEKQAQEAAPYLNITATLESLKHPFWDFHHT
ncbi:DUF2851 family protein, partial [Akkermansiaceae bacterium]|nr:DUF2851 family protein [Akkermansiaceae bacterium]